MRLGGLATTRLSYVCPGLNLTRSPESHCHCATFVYITSFAPETDKPQDAADAECKSLPPAIESSPGSDFIDCTVRRRSGPGESSLTEYAFKSGAEQPSSCGPARDTSRDRSKRHFSLDWSRFLDWSGCVVLGVPRISHSANDFLMCRAGLVIVSGLTRLG